MSELHDQEHLELDHSVVAPDVQATGVLAGPDDTQRPRKRVRKSCEDEASPSETRTVAKSKGKGRRTAGMLSELMSVPLDVFFEVAAHLHPFDMLNLARSSKSLRSLVLAKSSRSAWIASFATVQRLPPCPANMSEPFYAALLFDCHCFLCGSAQGKWVDYAIRLRLCKTCYDANIRKASTFLDEDEMHLLNLFPCESGPDYKSAQKFVLSEKRTGRNKYYADRVISSLNEVLAMFSQEDREDSSLVVREMLSDVTKAHLHAFDVLIWFKERSLLKRLANQDLMEGRKSKIVERLQELGYTEDDFPKDLDAWDKLVDQPKPLTDRIWNNIRPKLEKLLAIEKEHRAQQAVVDRINNRLDILVQWYEEYIEENFTDAERGLMPNRHDARELPSLITIALEDDGQGVLSREAFLATAEQMLADTDAYKARAKRELADILCEHSAVKVLKLNDLPADDVLQGPLAYFRCLWRCTAVTSVDGCPLLTYEQLHAHWREAHPDDPWLLQGEEGYRYTAVSIPDLCPESLPSVARSALFAAPIRLETPREVVDGWVREGRLFCTCEHPGMPLPGEMNWAKLLYHLLCQSHEERERAGEMRRLQGKHNPNHVLRPAHSLIAGYGCCVKFLPTGADTAVASVRTTVDDACRAQIEERLAARPDPGAVAVCRICKGLSRKTPLQMRRRLRYLRLPERPEEIVWHLRCCHGKEFEKRDILFVSL